MILHGVTYDKAICDYLLILTPCFLLARYQLPRVLISLSLYYFCNAMCCVSSVSTVSLGSATTPGKTSHIGTLICVPLSGIHYTPFLTGTHLRAKSSCQHLRLLGTCFPLSLPSTLHPILFSHQLTSSSCFCCSGAPVLFLPSYSLPWAVIFLPPEASLLSLLSESTSAALAVMVAMPLKNMCVELLVVRFLQRNRTNWECI